MPTAEQRQRGRRRRRRRTVVLVAVLVVAVGGCAVVLWPRNDGLTREEEAAERACATYRDTVRDATRFYGNELSRALTSIQDDARRSGSPGLQAAAEQLYASFAFPGSRRGVQEALAGMGDACMEDVRRRGAPTAG